MRKNWPPQDYVKTSIYPILYFKLGSDGRRMLDKLIKIFRPETEISGDNIRLAMGNFITLVVTWEKECQEAKDEMAKTIIEIFSSQENLSVSRKKQVLDLAETEYNALGTGEELEERIEKYLEMLNFKEEIKTPTTNYEMETQTSPLEIYEGWLNYLNSNPDKEGLKTAIATLKEESKNGSKEAVFLLLGHCYENGIGVEKSMMMACEYVLAPKTAATSVETF
jgi:hypothetical protein